MKKLVSVLATLVLALQLTAISASAATASIGNVTAKPGEEVTVNIELADCEIWSNVGLTTTYDNTVLELTGAKNMAPVTAVVPNASKYGDMPIVTTWTSGEGTDHNGVMATLTFKVKEDAPAGTYDLALDFYKGKKGTYKDGKNVNYYMDEDMIKTSLGLSYVSGSITVEVPAPAGPAMEATLADDVVSITATPDGEFAGKFIVAAYNGEELAEVIVTDAAATASATITADYDDVKVMWWDSLTSLTSIVDAIDL